MHVPIREVFYLHFVGAAGADSNFIFPGRTSERHSYVNIWAIGASAFVRKISSLVLTHITRAENLNINLDFE